MLDEIQFLSIQILMARRGILFVIRGRKQNKEDEGVLFLLTDTILRLLPSWEVTSKQKPELHDSVDI